ncbi:MAG TPA: RsmB/NOP family class I SAM-dependent RNA methyltransferase [Candidatus Nanoarchaeia archaeon]|nr:RsmB/NOP family class I SAM-dependent RNA methyltransferase [Candidatus Nanoarchaeia archaeon]
MNHKKNPELKPLFLERMKILLPEKSDYENYLKILKIPPVKSIRCNTLKITSSELKRKLEDNGWVITQPWKKYPEVMIVEGKSVRQCSQIDIAPKSLSADFSAKNIVNAKKTSNLCATNHNNLKNNSIINKLSPSIPSEASEFKFMDLEPGELGRSLEHLLGYYYIQELASMLPIIALEPKPKEIVLDLCAAPGSKTTQAVAFMKNSGAIIANEVSMSRLKILASNLERCGVTNTIITKKEGSILCNELNKQKFVFDKVLIDAPCSGEGTLRSSPATYIMWNIKTIKSLPRIQKNLIKSAISVLKIGGEFIYSTCTHAPEENEGVIDAILKEFPNIKIEAINLPINCRDGITSWGGHKYSNEVKKSCRIYPHDSNTEGFFIAKLRKLKEVG